MPHDFARPFSKGGPALAQLLRAVGARLTSAGAPRTQAWDTAEYRTGLGLPRASATELAALVSRARLAPTIADALPDAALLPVLEAEPRPVVSVNPDLGDRP
jgi:hypothetical protein